MKLFLHRLIDFFLHECIETCLKLAYSSNITLKGKNVLVLNSLKYFLHFIHLKDFI